MKIFVLLISILSLFTSCKERNPASEQQREIYDTIVKPQPSVNLTIVPGQSIGNVSLEQNATELSFLGTADLSDAAMGKSWETWYSTNSKRVNGKTELNIYTTYKDNGMTEKVVRQIRMTSPDFKTPNGIQVNSSFEDIRSSFPELHLLGSFIKPGTTDTVKLYDAIDSGIAFEIDNTQPDMRCLAIIIHRKTVPVTEEYLNFHPDLKKP